MKLKFNLLALLALVIIASCDNDDSPKRPAEVIQGNYEGVSIAEHKYSENAQTTKGEKLILTANTDGTNKIVLTSSIWGTFTIPTAEISLKANTYSLKGSGKVVMGMKGQPEKEYDCIVDGTVSSDKTAIELIFTVPTVMGGLKVTFELNPLTLDEVVIGIHKGGTNITVNNNAQNPIKDHMVTIKSQENKKLEVTLAGFAGLKNMELEDIVIRDVEVVLSTKNTYSLSGVIDTMSGIYKIKGKVDGTITPEETKLNFSIIPGLMPFPIIAVFKGVKQK